jgi:hypothetical protein
VSFETDSPDQVVTELLRRAKRRGIDEETITRIVFYVEAGEDHREGNIVWRLSAALLQTLSEFAVENQELVLKDPRVRPILVAVLTRMADSSIGDVDTGDEMLRHVLKATLNGVIDARDSLDGDRAWLEALLSAFADARQRAEVSDDFLIGLLHGRGYRLLVATLLEQGAGLLADEGAEIYQQIITDVLIEAAVKVQADPGSLESFFQDNWDDLARAGLRSLESHGPELLAGSDPLLRTSLVAAVGALAATPNRDFLSAETLERMAEASIAAIAAKPELLSQSDDRGSVFARELFVSVADLVAEQGLRELLNAKGLEAIARTTMMTAAEHPELLVKDHRLAQTVVAELLRKLSAAKGLQLEVVAGAVVEGSLEAIAENPQLLDIPFASVIAEVAGGVATRLKAESLSRIQAADLLAVVTQVVASNPELFVAGKQALAKLVVEAVLDATDGDPRKLAQGSMVVEIVRAALQVVAARGVALLGEGSDAQLAARVGEVISAGLSRAGAELGLRIDRRVVPATLAALLEEWAAGGGAAVSADDPEFEERFARLAEEAMVLAA